jgi:hypothetical protein
LNEGFKEFLSASEKDRVDTFLAASQRLGANVQYIEKDFWVCWTLDVLYHGLPGGGPRLLFKGGTSLSKAYGLINRFSEDIDITAFREDLNQGATIEELEALSGKKRNAKLDAIRDACQVWVKGILRGGMTARVAEFVGEKGESNSMIRTATDKPCSCSIRRSQVVRKVTFGLRCASNAEQNRRSTRTPRRRFVHTLPRTSINSIFLCRV